jgi:uncharacterized protein (TIGR03083 family)
MTPTPDPAVDAWFAAVSHSHQRLVGMVEPMTVEELTGPSYASEWSVAQVLSHLGSGAEIFTLFVEAGLQGDEAPGVAEFQPVWDRWNAKSPEAQSADALVADRGLIDLIDRMDQGDRDSWELSMFGSDQRLSDLLRLRLGEHALHTWDVAVTQDPDASVAPDAVELLIDVLDQLVARAGGVSGPPIRLAVSTHDPDRQFLLTADSEGAALLPSEGSTTPTPERSLRLPAEALIRLVYGRLDPLHTPPLEAEDGDLDALRTLFPGF